MTKTQNIYNFLLIEDNASDILLTQKSLEKTKIPYKLTIARNGRDALNLLKSDKGAHFDIVFLDMNLPDMNGKNILKAIKSDTRLSKLKTVILTGNNRDENSNAEDFIRKPINTDHIVRLARDREKEDQVQERLNTLEINRGIADGIDKWVRTVCITATSAIFTFFFWMGSTAYDKLPALKAAIVAFIQTDKGLK